MQKAIAPGKRRIHGPRMLPLTSMSVPRPWKRAGKPSTGMASSSREKNIMGAR